jgi:flagellar biosynthesis protein FlhB
MQGMLSNLKETAKSILVSQTIGKVINGDEADITKLRGTSHSTTAQNIRNFLCALIGVFLIDLCIGFQRINRVLVLL